MPKLDAHDVAALRDLLRVTTLAEITPHKIQNWQAVAKKLLASPKPKDDA